jgi:hypothetical protein
VYFFTLEHNNDENDDFTHEHVRHNEILFSHFIIFEYFFFKLLETKLT